MSNTVPFTEVDVKNYLDVCINFWRNKKINGNENEKDMAVYYIDAYQSVRISLFGESLPPKRSI